jgi:intein/homing endonuclease
MSIMRGASQVAVLRTRPETVVEDYGRLMRLVKYDQLLPRDQELILKLNLSWTKYFPACSSQPWQVEGIVNTLIEDGYDRARVLPVENKTVVTDPVKGARNNKWRPILDRFGLPFIPLPGVEWTKYRFQSPLLKLNRIFPEGIEIPKMYVGRNVLHMPTVKCVHPDTEILLADGSLVRAEALVKAMQVREPIREYDDGDCVAEGSVRVISLERQGLGGAHATQFWRTPATDDTVWTVRTRTGRQVTTSARHPFLTPEGWMPASALTVGSRIAIARHVRVKGQSQPLPRVASWATAPEQSSPEFWRWIGYFVAEGHACPSSGSFRISFSNTDEALRDDYIELSRFLFGVEPKTRAGEVDFDSLNLQPFLESLGFPIPTSEGNKIVPEILFRCPDGEIAAFLSGYLDGDGKTGPVGVRATTRSQRLAGQLQLLFARLGVLAFARKIRSRAGRDREFSEYTEVAVYGDDVARLAERIRLRSAHKQLGMETFVHQGVPGRSRSRWDAVPVPRELFRRVTRGLGVTRASCGSEAFRNAARGAPVTRATVNFFVDLFSRLDVRAEFEPEIGHLRWLAAPDLAWDPVVELRPEPADVPFFYDLSVEGTSCFIGNSVVLHNTHGHSQTTGAIKNSFGGLLKEVRHYAHEYMHEVLVDLMYMQRELHPSVFAVMDGTVMGDGAGPRTMIPRVGNLILASADQVAIDAIAARIMGYDPLAIPYLRMCQERGLGVADPGKIEIVGDPEAASINMKFQTRRSLVIWGDQLIRRGPLRPLKRILLHSPLMVWAPFASNVYHDLLWYPTVGAGRIREFSRTEWGRLFEKYD